MSWGIWKKIKQGVAKVGGFVRNLLGGAPKAINNAVDTVNTLGKKALKGVKRASKVVQQFRDSDEEEESEELSEEDDSPPPPPPKSKAYGDRIAQAYGNRTFGPHRKAAKQVPKWRKLLERREVLSDDESASKYAVSYAGRSWLPKMKSKASRQNRLAIDDSEDLTE